MSRRRHKRGRSGAPSRPSSSPRRERCPLQRPPRTSRTFYGVVPEAGQLSPGDLAFMDAAHVGSARFVLNWQEVQPTPGGAFNWSRIDQVIETLALHKIVPLPELFGTPSLVSQTGSADVMNRWSAFVTAAVKRYKVGSPFWKQFKINHPNNGHRCRPRSGRSTTSRTSRSTGRAGPRRPSMRFLHASALAIRGAAERPDHARGDARPGQHERHSVLDLPEAPLRVSGGRRRLRHRRDPSVPARRRGNRARSRHGPRRDEQQGRSAGRVSGSPRWDGVRSSTRPAPSGGSRRPRGRPRCWTPPGECCFTPRPFGT